MPGTIPNLTVGFRVQHSGPASGEQIAAARTCRSLRSGVEHVATQPGKTAEALVERHERKSYGVRVGGQIGIGPYARTEGSSCGEHSRHRAPARAASSCWVAASSAA
jgi:hypothetical protein